MPIKKQARFDNLDDSSIPINMSINKSMSQETNNNNKKHQNLEIEIPKKNEHFQISNLEEIKEEEEVNLPFPITSQNDENYLFDSLSPTKTKKSK